MPAQDTLSTLRHLAQVDIDAIRAYTQAIENCGDRELAATLSAFRGDHERHVRDLSPAIRRLGGTPPNSADVTGFGIAGFTAVMAGAGTTGALTVMESNEIVTNDAYRQALSRELPADIRGMVERNREDERRHLEAIRGRLEATGRSGRALARAASVHGGTTALWMNTISRSVPLMLTLGAGAAWLLAKALGRRRAR